jgi:1-acyl-sn-glycerol-3-phosphate acyltransferase
MITVDREAGGSAMRALLRGADWAKADGRYIIIFPEGTRAEPGEQLPLQPGVAAMATRSKLPIVPVMTDSGRCWGRRAFRKNPGTIHILIQPGLVVTSGREAILDGLQSAFGSDRLMK